ncbi:hypothetical protein [Haliangium ochraceum]|uniref:DUF8091 domain-containing protein n=1 Tax=Haliangium ochraceum (strain DSM 14365 / JCM 11303 / SMP-2) TaxID=502025 RepID=D0LWF2_HALO1|nr:hypothetical protein [Haliangium ochraceum]ACY17602.1 hypothetical protein Hoch_5114 [Haliangium ochraceum DSM 14365]
MNAIGTLNEKPLHAALKEWYAAPGDRMEVPLDGFCIDLVRGERLIEIQTGSFSSMRRKLHALTASRHVHVVHPIALERWLVKRARGNEPQRRRKSPKRGRLEDVFLELVAFPTLLAHPRFSLEVVLVKEEEVRRFDTARKRRRGGWLTEERRLLEVVEQHVFASPSDFAALLPPTLPRPFLTSDLAEALRCPRWLAQKMSYCLRHMGALEAVGKRGNAIAYERAASLPAPRSAAAPASAPASASAA